MLCKTIDDLMRQHPEKLVTDTLGEDAVKTHFYKVSGGREIETVPDRQELRAHITKLNEHKNIGKHERKGSITRRAQRADNIYYLSAAQTTATALFKLTR